MAKSLIQLLAIPALLAGLVQSHPTDVKRDQYPPCPLRVDIADGTYFNIGDNFEIKWDPTGLPEAPVNLIIQSQLVTPYVTGHFYNPFTQREEDILEFDLASVRIPDPPLSSRGYTWPVEIIGRSNHTGPEYRYSAHISYTVLIRENAGDVTDSCFTPDFHVMTPA